jgi:hypothetical protein
MKIGDRVKVVKGINVGKAGIIIYGDSLSSEVVNMSEDSGALIKPPFPRRFTIKADDFSIFPAEEDQLELAEEVQLELDE